MAVIYVLLPVKELLYEDTFPGSRWRMDSGTFLSHIFRGRDGMGISCLGTQHTISDKAVSTVHVVCASPNMLPSADA